MCVREWTDRYVRERERASEREREREREGEREREKGWGRASEGMANFSGWCKKQFSMVLSNRFKPVSRLDHY